MALYRRCRTQFSQEHRRWREWALGRYKQAVVVAGCFAMELNGSWDNCASLDPWMLRCTYQIRPATGSSTK